MTDHSDMMVTIKNNYPNHPCGTKFCRKCKFPMIPPAYSGDYWDCTNDLCLTSYPPSKSDIKKMNQKPH